MIYQAAKSFGRVHRHGFQDHLFDCFRLRFDCRGKRITSERPEPHAALAEFFAGRQL